MNRSARALVRMFRRGANGSDNQQDRIIKASIIQDTKPPPVSFVWKTHKKYTSIPPTRPKCNASKGPIARTSNLLPVILTPIIKNRDYPINCDSTEDILWSTQQANIRLE